jgi:hypothetical protein
MPGGDDDGRTRSTYFHNFLFRLRPSYPVFIGDRAQGCWCGTRVQTPAGFIIHWLLVEREAVQSQSCGKVELCDICVISKKPTLHNF